VIALLEGEFTVKRLRKTSSGRVFLVADNPEYAHIEIKPEMGFEVWGVVTHVIHQI
jgi:DNA polymerase V